MKITKNNAITRKTAETPPDMISRCSGETDSKMRVNPTISSSPRVFFFSSSSSIGISSRRVCNIPVRVVKTRCILSIRLRDGPCGWVFPVFKTSSFCLIIDLVCALHAPVSPDWPGKENYSLTFSLTASTTCCAASLGVSLDIGNYCTFSALFNQITP